MTRRLRDVDHTGMLQRLGTLPLAFIIACLTFAAAVITANWKWYLALLASVVVFIVVLLLPERLAGKSGDAVAALYDPKGRSTPPPAQYSLADSLLVRGRIEEAAEAYQALSVDFPEDPQPRIRLARLRRDHQARFDEAAQLYRQALAAAAIEPAQKAAVLRELIELYTHKMKRPELALPYLARFAQEHADHPAAAWARQESSDIKRNMPVQNQDG